MKLPSIFLAAGLLALPRCALLERQSATDSQNYVDDAKRWLKSLGHIRRRVDGH